MTRLPLDYDLLGRVMELVLTDPYYEDNRMFGSRHAVYYAVKHGKCLLYEVDGEVLGYCTYGFFTNDELISGDWHGDEVYARMDGEVLYFPKFCCRSGRRGVIQFIRQIQSFLSGVYPDLQTAHGLRVYPDGSTRNEVWHRKVV